MNSVTWPSSATILNLLPNAAITTTQTGAGVDIQPYRGTALVLLDVSGNTAGAAPTLATKLQTSPEANKVTSTTFVGTGTGRLEIEAGPDPVAEDITITFSNATTAAVVGSVSGALGTLTVGTRFSSAQVKALATAGAVAFVNLDAFTCPTTARTWTDSVAFTAQTTAALRQSKIINTDQAPRFIRAVATLGGAATAYVASCNLLATAD